MGHLLLKFTAIPVILLAAVACESTGAAGHGGQEARTPADAARTLYESSCARCHALYMPTSFTASEWKFYVRKYGRKARLTKEQRDVVYGYLAEHSLVLASSATGP